MVVLEREELVAIAGVDWWWVELVGKASFWLCNRLLENSRNEHI